MVKGNTYNYLVDFLVDKIKKSIPPDYGSEDKSPVKRTEAELCDLFENHIHLSGNKNFMFSNTGVIWVFNGKHYEKVETKTFLQEIIKRAMKKMGVALVYQKFSHKKIAEECMAGMENSHEDEKFNPNRRYIVFNNGVFDVEEGVLKDFSKDLCTDMILDIDYDPQKTNELWDEKLVEIIPNEQMRKAFQLFCGMLLINREKIKIEYMCYLLGPGSNGKSIIAQAVADVFGDQYFAKFAPKQLFKETNSEFRMAALDGMMANFTDDLEKDDFSGGLFKRFVSGEKFPARHPYGRHFFYVSAPIMLCCANDMPATTDDSWGHHRRNLPIYSTTRIRGEKDKDPKLRDKLRSKDARAAIFNWIYEGYQRIIANGGNIDLGDDVIEAQKELRDDSNSLRRWIRDRGYVKIEDRPNSDPAWKSQVDWHKDYTNYCQENGEKSPKISKSMAQLFKEKGFISKRRGSGIWWLIGQIEDKDAEVETTDPFGNPINRITADTPESDLPF